MERVGSFEYSRKCINELGDKASKIVDELENDLGEQGREGGDNMRKILEKLTVKL